MEDLQAVLSGKKEHTPRKKVVAQAEPPKVNLLVDIQAKLQAGKGAGYARWAKVFNLKQMAQTMNYLSENNLLECICQGEVDTENHHVFRSPVRFCTELGFYSPEQPQAAQNYSNEHTPLIA